MRSLFVYWKLPPAALPAAMAQLRALHAGWTAQADLQARLYQRPQADAQGRLTCMATYHAPAGLDAAWLQRITEQLQRALPGGHVEIFDESSR